MNRRNIRNIHRIRRGHSRQLLPFWKVEIKDSGNHGWVKRPAGWDANVREVKDSNGYNGRHTDANIPPSLVKVIKNEKKTGA